VKKEPCVDHPNQTQRQSARGKNGVTTPAIMMNMPRKRRRGVRESAAAQSDAMTEPNPYCRNAIENAGRLQGSTKLKENLTERQDRELLSLLRQSLELHGEKVCNGHSSAFSDPTSFCACVPPSSLY
jgi:hypothetical protein